jgi:antitoxin ParD1/3/4
MRIVYLTPELDRFVDQKLQRGDYANASELICASLRVLEAEEREFEDKSNAIQHALEAGEQSGVAKGNMETEIGDRIRRRALLNKGK